MSIHLNNDSNNLIFSIYPLTQVYRDRLELTLKGKNNYLDLSTLRKRGALGAVIYIIKQKCSQLILASESTESEGLISVLKSFALMSRAKQIYLLSPEQHFTPISRLKILGSLMQIVFATISGYKALMYASIDMGKYCKHVEQAYVKEKGNVLYLNTNLWYGVKVGGSVGHIAGVINELQKEGNKVYYAAISDSSVIHSGVNRTLLKSPVSFGLPPEINTYRFDFHNYKTLRDLTENIQPSFIYQRLSVCSYMGAKLAQKFNLPLIVEYNGSEVWIARNWGRPLTFEKTAKRAEDVMLKRANVVVTISEVLRDELIERGVYPNKIVYYPNCIDPEVFNPARFSKNDILAVKEKYNLDQDTKLITFLGTFGQWHGVDVLAKSIVKLVKEKKSWLDLNKVKFLLIGDGLKMPLVKDIIEENNAMNYCILTGLIAQHEAPLYLSASDILVSPHVKNPDGTKFFGSPTKLFEYLAMGKPVIASDLEQIGEVLKNSFIHNSEETIDETAKLQRVAYLTEPGNVAQLSDAIIHVIERPDMREILGRNSRQLALDKYTWARHVTEILLKL